MKKHIKHSVGLMLVLFLWVSVIPVRGQEEDSANYITISGLVKDKQSRKGLEYVNISIPGSNIGTVTNADGVFTIKVDEGTPVPVLEISHIGYQNNRVQLDKEHLDDLKIWLTPHANMLNEIVVYANEPRRIVEKAISKISVNYSNKSNMLTGFYRETVQKGRRYINISEAVINTYKTSYDNLDVTKDRVQVLKGRRLLSQKRNDTLAVKLAGGPTLSVYVDIVKNQDALLDVETLNFYQFQMEEPVQIDNRLQYVISFYPRVVLPYALYYGKLYIDREKLSFTRAEFSLSMDNKVKAVDAILAKKPYGLRFKPQELSYLVTYKDQGGKTYLNYIRNIIRFKCDWKRKLFSTGYTVLSEMVVTDRKDNSVLPIPAKLSFSQTQPFYDKVYEYWNEDFWGAYNIIEPTESLENAVHKLKKQSH
ncbi:carboxypeptidase-like regulatory domain-containing protein [Phocaeicola sp.]